jgi:hypothetical protein
MREEKGICEMVREAVDKKPSLREDGTALLHHVWKKQGAELPNLREMRKLGNPDTILREGRR